MEKMTISVFAILHGDTEGMAETETWEAETREELADRYITFLRETAQKIEEAIVKDVRG